jgi:hypothetical protein
MSFVMRKAVQASASKPVQKTIGAYRTMTQMASMADALGWVRHTNPQSPYRGTRFLLSQQQGFPQASASYSRQSAGGFGGSGGSSSSTAAQQGRPLHADAEASAGTPPWGYEQGYASEFDVHRNPAEEPHGAGPESAARTVYEQRMQRSDTEEDEEDFI